MEEYRISHDGILQAARHLISGTSTQFIPGETYISPHGAIIDGDDVQTLVDCSLGMWYTEGRFAKKFSQQLRLYLENRMRSVTLCNSGSSATLLAVSAMTAKEFGERRLLPGDEVITTAVGFPTTVNAVVQNHAIPVFVDVELRTYVPTIDTIEEAVIEGKTKAVVLAHTLGNPFPVQEIKDLCSEYNLFLLEDTCDGLGGTYNDRQLGTWGDFATLSFYPAHHLCAGEGGAVLSNSPMIQKVMDSFRDWGRGCWCKPGSDNTCGKRFEYCWENLPKGYDHKYVYERLGYNLKMTDLQAALLSSQINKLPDFVAKRRYNFMYFDELMQEFDDWFILPKATRHSEPSWFGYPITLKSYACSFGRKELIDFLTEHKVGTRLMFAGNLINQPAYKDVDYRIHKDLYNSDIVQDYTFWLGVWPGLDEEHYEYIGSVFRKFLKDKK